MNGTGIEDYPPQTMEFYASCIGPSQLNTVVAVTGGMKTFFLLNLANFAAMVGMPVCFVNLQMHVIEIRKRMIAMTNNLPLWELEQHRDRLSGTVQAQAKAIKFLDLSAPLRISADDVRQQILMAISQLPAPALILVDGLESMAEYDRAKTEALIAQLGSIATDMGACIWMTAQGNRQASGVEIFDIPAIAETSAKAQISSQVLALGPRIDNQLLTASWTKARNGSDEFGGVVRLVVRPSVRLEVLEVVGDPVRLFPLPEVRPQPVFIGCEPKTTPMPEDVETSSGESDIEDAEDDPAHSPLRLYHGPKGWVGIGRAVAASPMFANREAKYVFWLVDLYFMAQFAPGTLYAPKTKHPVKLVRGQIMTSPRMLADRWGVSRKQVETFLATAAREGLITVEIEFATHRAAHDASDAQKPTTEPRERALCSVITLLHYEGDNDKETE